MITKHCACALVFMAICCPPTFSSAQIHSEEINGATCIPYPPSFDSTTSVPFGYQLVGFDQSAYCHLTMSSEWPVTDLVAVFIDSRTSGTVRIRLCVHNFARAVACGAERTITAATLPRTEYVEPPGRLPPSPIGTFVFVRFPAGTVSTFNTLTPVWSR